MHCNFRYVLHILNKILSELVSKVIWQEAASPYQPSRQAHSPSVDALRHIPLPVGSFPSNTWFLGSIWVSLPSTISIGSAVLAQLTRMSNTQTDTQTTLRETSVEIGRISCTACRRYGIIIYLLHSDSAYYVTERIEVGL